MNKEELLDQIANSDINTTISSITSREQGEQIIALAKILEYEGRIILEDYQIENKPLSVSLKTKVIK
jgi:hypothetical protein